MPARMETDRRATGPPPLPVNGPDVNAVGTADARPTSPGDGQPQRRRLGHGRHRWPGERDCRGGHAAALLVEAVVHQRVVRPVDRAVVVEVAVRPAGQAGDEADVDPGVVGGVDDAVQVRVAVVRSVRTSTSPSAPAATAVERWRRSTAASTRSGQCWRSRRRPSGGPRRRRRSSWSRPADPVHSAAGEALVAASCGHGGHRTAAADVEVVGRSGRASRRRVRLATGPAASGTAGVGRRQRSWPCRAVCDREWAGRAVQHRRWRSTPGRRTTATRWRSTEKP